MGVECIAMGWLAQESDIGQVVSAIGSALQWILTKGLPALIFTIPIITFLANRKAKAQAGAEAPANPPPPPRASGYRGLSRRSRPQGPPSPQDLEEREDERVRESQAHLASASSPHAAYGAPHRGTKRGGARRPSEGKPRGAHGWRRAIVLREVLGPPRALRSWTSAV